jgi:hypothetical protein
MPDALILATGVLTSTAFLAIHDAELATAARTAATGMEVLLSGIAP